MKALVHAEQFGRSQRRRPTRSSVDATPPGEIVIRRASGADRGALHRLAVLDSAPDPQGPTLIGEREGVLVAAVPLAGGRSITDPFVPSKDVLGLLELARHVRGQR